MSATSSSSSAARGTAATAPAATASATAPTSTTTGAAATRSSPLQPAANPAVVSLLSQQLMLNSANTTASAAFPSSSSSSSAAAIAPAHLSRLDIPLTAGSSAMPVSGAANSSAGSSSSAPPSNASTSADSNASGAPHRQLPLPLPTPALKKKTIPTLAEYGVSATSAFMPTDPPPLLRLPAYFEPWELVLDDLTSLLLANRLRRRVLALPTLDTARLSTLREWQRAYLVLSFIGQGYVWGKNENAEEVLPANVAVPWCAVCFHLDLKPIISYASVELYNYKLLDPLDPPTLDNLAILHTFSGGTDEAWFYLISLAMEAAGAPAVPAIIDALNAVETGDLPRLRAALEIIEVAIEQLNEILPRMYEKNDGHIFFHRVRPYMNGWEKSDDLPNGVLYEGVTAVNGVPNGLPSTGELPQGTYGKYAGASAGQSPLIHVIDLAMGITHFPAKTMGGPPPTPSGTPITHQPQSPSGQDASVLAARAAVSPTSPRAFSFSLSNMMSSMRGSLATSPAAPSPIFSTTPSLLSAVNDPAAPSLPVIHSTSAATPTGAAAPEAGTPVATPSSSKFNFIHAMREYMPGPFRRFVYAIADSYSIRSFVEGIRIAALKRRLLHIRSRQRKSEYGHNDPDLDQDEELSPEDAATVAEAVAVASSAPMACSLSLSLGLASSPRGAKTQHGTTDGGVAFELDDSDVGAAAADEDDDDDVEDVDDDTTALAPSVAGDDSSEHSGRASSSAATAAAAAAVASASNGRRHTGSRANNAKRARAEDATATEKAWLGEVDSTVDAFNRCVEGMRAFRDKHIQMVALYIVVQARKKMEVGYVGTPAGVKTERVNQALLARGTGGTNLMPFLKQTRDETTAARVGPSV